MIRTMEFGQDGGAPLQLLHPIHDSFRGRLRSFFEPRYRPLERQRASERLRGDRLRVVEVSNQLLPEAFEVLPQLLAEALEVLNGVVHFGLKLARGLRQVQARRTFHRRQLVVRRAAEENAQRHPQDGGWRSRCRSW